MRALSAASCEEEKHSASSILRTRYLNPSESALEPKYFSPEGAVSLITECAIPIILMLNGEKSQPQGCCPEKGYDSRMSQLTPKIESFYQSWLGKIDPCTCRPHFYNLSHQHKTVFVMKTPLKKWWLTQPPARSPVQPYVDACREALIRWLKKDGEAWTQMACALPDTVVGAKLTTINELIENVYFTDCVKCESEPDDQKSKSDDKDDKKYFKYHIEHTATCLCDEFALLKGAVLFITLGDYAWNRVWELLAGRKGEGLKRAQGGCYRHLMAEPRAKSTQSTPRRLARPVRPNGISWTCTACFMRITLAGS